MKKYIGAIIVIIIVITGAIIYSSSNENKMVAKDSNSGDTIVVNDDSMMKDSKSTEGADTMMKNDKVMMNNEKMMMETGSYEAYAPEKLAKATEGKVVLFFNASWCPTCKAAVADINSHLKDIPSNLTILSVDYDSSTELKKKYGVTYQHTFVEVDANGNMIKKWSGSETLAKIVAQVK